MKAMNEQEMNEYINKILNEESVFDGLELEAVTMAKNFQNELQMARTNLENQIAEIDKLKLQHQELNGKFLASVQLLVRAENIRRSAIEEVSNDSHERKQGDRSKEVANES